CTWAYGIDPESNQTSKTSSTRRIMDLPVGSSGFGRTSSSIQGRCRSTSPSVFRGSLPKACSSSDREPSSSSSVWLGSWDSHTGMGEPQYRLREIDQSRAFSSHFPNWPCLTLPGIQLMSSLMRNMSSLKSVTLTYQEVIAR